MKLKKKTLRLNTRKGEEGENGNQGKNHFLKKRFFSISLPSFSLSFRVERRTMVIVDYLLAVPP